MIVIVDITRREASFSRQNSFDLRHFISGWNLEKGFLELMQAHSYMMQLFFVVRFTCFLLTRF